MRGKMLKNLNGRFNHSKILQAHMKYSKDAAIAVLRSWSQKTKFQYHDIKKDTIQIARA